MESMLILLAVGYLLLAPVAFVIAVVALVKARRVDARLSRLEFEQVRLEGRLKDQAPGGIGEAETETPPPSTPVVEKVHEPAPQIITEPAVAMEGPAPPTASQEVTPASGESDAIDSTETDVGAGPPPVDKVEPAPPTPPKPPSPERSDEPPPPAPPDIDPPTPPKPPWWSNIDIESVVGVKGFSWLAGIALVISAVFFLRYSIDHGWLSPPVRMAIGLVTGIALLVVCELKAARRYSITANALDGAGIAVLFATFFSSHILWKLMPVVPTFAAMALVAATAVVLAVRRDSLFIALLGLVGGFATPFMLSSALDRPLSLFGYLVILNAGLAWVAYRRGWPVLTALSLVFTTLHQWVWVARFLDSAQVGLALGVFLVFPLLGFAGLVLARVSEEKLQKRFERTALIGAVLPLLFAAYLAAVPAYGERYGLLFSFLFLVVAGLAVIAVWRGPQQLHLIGAASTLVVFAVWMASSYRDAWPGVLVFLVLFVVFFLGVPEVARRLNRPLGAPAERAILAAPLLLFVIPGLIVIEPKCSAPLPIFAALFVLMGLIAAVAVVRSQGMLHLTAAFFAVIAEAAWSVRYLNEESLLSGLAVYGVFALFYLGVPMLARRYGRPLQPVGGAAALLLVSLALLFFIALGSAAQAALWGLALLLVVLNAGLFLEGAAGRVPVLSIVGTVLSWLVLAAWWATADVSIGLVPALVVVAGFAVLSVAGTALLGSRANQEARPDANVIGGGVYLLLVGHAFLLFVSARPELAVPPWPLLGVMLVLDVAAGAAALAIRKGGLWVASLVASVFVLLTFEMTADLAPWPGVAVTSALGLAALAIVWWRLAGRRLGTEHRGLDIFVAGAALSLLLAQGVALVSALLAGSPALAVLIRSHLILVIALLVVVSLRRWFWIAAVAVVPTFAAVMIELVSGATWREVIFFDVVAWAPFVALPLILGRRVLGDRWPWLTPVLASVPFFYIAKEAMVEGGFEHVIGVLPVAQAIVLALVVIRLIRIESPAERDVGRLALLAAAVLAFITVAIPLQLEKQWITIGWALEGMALAWLYTRLRHRGLLAGSMALLTVVLIRLTLNPAVLAYHARSDIRIFNWYLYTYLVAAAATFAAAYLLRNVDSFFGVRQLKPQRVLPAFGTVLLFLLLNIEIADFFATGPTLTFSLRGASLAQDLSYTLGWAVFAIGLLAAGVIFRNRAGRLTSIVLLAVTVLKAFLHDLPSLGGLYRVASFGLLAVSLALVAVALQKFVLHRSGEDEG